MAKRIDLSRFKKIDICTCPETYYKRHTICLRMHMKENNKSRTISIRFDSQLYNKVHTNELQNSELIRKAVIQYFRSKETNQKLDGEHLGYNQELIDVLKIQIDDLKQDKHQLQQQNNYLTVPWYQRLFLPLHKQ